MLDEEEEEDGLVEQVEVEVREEFGLAVAIVGGQVEVVVGGDLDE